MCLLDALQTIDFARYALLEGHAHGIYYREVAEPRNEGTEVTANWFERFFIDDAAHRLYGAGPRTLQRD